MVQHLEITKTNMTSALAIGPSVTRLGEGCGQDILQIIGVRMELVIRRC